MAFLVHCIFTATITTENVITQLLDFLKYYIGAVIVEIIGLIVFITKNTFTSFSKDIIKGLFGDKLDDNVDES